MHSAALTWSESEGLSKQSLSLKQEAGAMVIASVQ
jgi:hypothetical protein